MNSVEVDPSDLHIGDDVTAWYKPAGSSGQGGIVVRVEEERVVLCAGTARVIHEISLDLIHHWTREEPFPAEECLNYGPDCSGPVDYWWSGGDRSWPRCAFHGEKRLRDRENSVERYADSDVVPDWFDPSYAGERWDDDY